MLYIRSNIGEQQSTIHVLKEIAKNMKVPAGILTHVLETNKDNYGKIYHYDVCEFLAEAIEVSDKERFYVLNMRMTPIDYTVFSKIGAYECISMARLGWSGRFNNQKDAETAKKYSSSIVSICKEQSRIISEKENLNLPQNENRSIGKKYKNSQNLFGHYANLSKGFYNNIAKKHEFILDNFSCLNNIIVKYFERRKSTENLIDSAYEPLCDISLSEDIVLDELNMLKENLNSTDNINYVKLKDLIVQIQEQAGCLELDSNNINHLIKKIMVTRLTGQLKNRLENLL